MSLYYCADSSFPLICKYSEFRSLFCGSKAASLQKKNPWNVLFLWFSDTAEKCHQEMPWQGPRMTTNGLAPTQSAFLLNGEIRRGIAGLLWLPFGLKSLGWHWATQAVFIIDFTGTVRIRFCVVVVIITADLCWFFFSNYLIALQKKIKQPVIVVLD